MKKITVKKLDGTLIHESPFEQDGYDEAWLDQNIGTNAWGKPDRWLPDFLEGAETRQNVFDEETSTTEYLHPAEYTIEYGFDYSSELSEAKKQMDLDIYNEAFKYFGTNDINSMNAFAQSWNLKKDHAEFYVNDGLTATFAFPGFTKGMQLDTATKIRAYYTAMCQTLVAFDKFRDNRIGQYLEQIAAYK